MGQTFYRTGDGGGTLDVTSSPKALDYDKGVAWCYFDFRTDYGELKENNKKRLLTDWTARWNAAHDWAERQLKSVEGKSYDELIKKTNLGEAFLKNSTTFDSCRVSYKLDEQQRLKEVVFQFPFLDNAYYDKEQFFAKAVKNREGLFEVINTQKSLNIGDKLVLVPFDKRLLLCTYDSYSKACDVVQILSPNYADALETNILHDDRVYAIDGAIESKDMNKTTEAYGEWWKRKNFSQEYNGAADLVVFSNFITKYMQTIKK